MTDRTRTSTVVTALVGATALLSACDGFLDVELPDRVLADEALQPRNASTLLSGVIADYECAHAAYVSWTASLGDEFLDGGTGDGVEQRATIRRESPSNWATAECEGAGLYIPISVARWSADNLLTNLDEWTEEQVPNRASMLTQAAVYSGFAHLFHAEAMCEAAFDGGPAISTDAVLELAEARFTRAMEEAQAIDDPDLLDFARVGRARARLGLARRNGAMVRPQKLREAAEDAALVRDGFVRLARYATVSSRTENHVWSGTGPGSSAFSSVGEPYRNAAFDGVADPRLPVIDTGEETDEGLGIPFWQQRKYLSPSDPIEIASWEEAQLIVAEAAIEDGDLQAAVDIINELHRRAGLPDTFESDDGSEVFSQLIYERRAELFLEGQLLGDQRRYNLPFSPEVGTSTARGFTYGTTRCFPLPDIETLNNPNVSG